MIRTSIPRLHSVQLKSGGAKVRVLENKGPEKLCRNFLNDAEEIERKRSKDMIGYAIVAWARDDSLSTVFDLQKEAWLSPYQIPDFVYAAFYKHVWSN